MRVPPPFIMERPESDKRPASAPGHLATAVALAAWLLLAPQAPAQLLTDDHPDRAEDVTLADTLKLGAAATPARIERPGDVDVFSLVVTAGTTLSIETRLDGISDTVLRVYSGASRGSLVAENDDARPGTRASRLDLVPPASGTLFVEVAHFLARAGTGRYTVRAFLSSGAQPLLDDRADTAAAALAPGDLLVAGGATLAGELEAPGDADFFRFDASAKEIYSVEVLLESLEDSLATLFGPDSRRVEAENDDAAGTTGSRVSEFRPRVDGTHYVRVRHPRNLGVGRYRISLATLADDHPDSPLATRAPRDRLVTGAAALPATLQTPQDVDCFSFAGSSSGAYKLQATPGTARRLSLEILDIDGRNVLASVSGLDLQTATIRPFQPDLTGLYFARVRGADSEIAGSYTLRLSSERRLTGSANPPPVISLAVTDTASGVVAAIDATAERFDVFEEFSGTVLFDPRALSLTQVTSGPGTAGASFASFDAGPGAVGIEVKRGLLPPRAGRLATLRLQRAPAEPFREGLVALRSALSRTTDERLLVLAPTANAGADRVVERLAGVASIPDPLAPESSNLRDHVRLDGRASSDSNDPSKRLTYRWTVASAPGPVTLSAPASAAPTFAPQVPGLYLFDLVVENGLLGSLADRVAILVNRLNRPPTAQARVVDLASGRGADALEGTLRIATGSRVRLDGRLAFDPDPQDVGRLRFEWRQLEGASVALLPASTAAAPETTVTTAGRYRFELAVSDPAGARSPPFEIGFLAVEPENTPPILSIVSSASTTAETGGDLADGSTGSASATLRVTLPVRVTLKAAVFDPDLARPPLKQRMAFAWTQLSGPQVQVTTTAFAPSDASVSAIAFEPRAARVLELECVAAEHDAADVPTGVRVARRVRVIVDDPSERTPVARARAAGRAAGSLGKRPGPPHQAGEAPLAPGDVVELDASGSTDPETASTLRYTWSQLEGPRVVLSNPFAQITTFVLPETPDATRRTYLFQLVVDDGVHASEPALTRVTAVPPDPIGFELQRGAGARLVSLASDPSTTGDPYDSTDLLTSLAAGAVLARMEPDPQTGRGRFAPVFPGTQSQPYRLESVRGYLLLGGPTGPPLALTGQPWPRSRRALALHPGLNLVGWPAPAPPEETAASLLARVAGAHAFLVRARSEAGRTLFEVHLPELTGTQGWPIEPGRGYLLSVPAPTVLSLPAYP
ncbi:MAG: PPC domain-containing protein [Candidatus Wallbacteria bacterium]|nr:PPC domain-containing protein [Candidatus Wallbacteria bacterium]